MLPNTQANGFRVGPSALPRSWAHPLIPIEKRLTALRNYRIIPRNLSAAKDLRRRSWVVSAAAADVESAEKTESQELEEGSQAVELSRPVTAEAEGHPEEQSGQEQATTSGQGAEKDGRPAEKNWQRNGRTASIGRQNQKGRRSGNRGSVKDFPFKVGDVIMGQVIGGQNGWRVALEHDKNILGFCPHSEMPQILRHAVEEPVWNDTKRGLRRPFQIKVIPADMEYNGKGPLLSARAIDLDVLWKRAEQIKDVCVEDGEVITIHVNKLNVGGCLGTFEGLPTFVPFSFVPRMPRGGVKDREAMAQTYVGKDMQVTIVDVRRESNRFVGNMIEAMQNKAFNKLKVGDIVWGFVNATETYGAFITLDDHPSVRGLLHIASISRAHVDSMNGLFHVGEKVRSLVVGIDSSKFRVSLSTAELEPESGDMLFNKAKVYQHAEENVADFRQWVVQRQKEIESGEVEIEDVEEDTLDWNA